MNIDDYRAMVAQEKADKESAKDQTNTAEVKNENPETLETVETKNEPITSVTLEGLGEVTVDQIKQWRDSGLRIEDYTRKTQEVARTREENKQAIELLNFVKANPQIAEVLLNSNPTSPDARRALETSHPILAKQSKLEQELADLKLERDLTNLKLKYDDFDVVSVLNKAQEKGITNLEDAYKLTLADKVITTPKSQESQSQQATNSTVDIDKLKAELRAELLKDLESERDTSSIISTKSSTSPTTPETPDISPEQLRVLEMQGLTVADYLKWSKK